MKTISKNAMIGYSAGIITGVTYGLNPLFAVPLMKNGASIESILFFRYTIAVLLLGGFLLFKKQSFKVSLKQGLVLFILGVLFTLSSLFLFEAYKYIASGLATTLIYLFPVFVAIIMGFLRVVPSWQVWLSIVVTFVGVVVMTQSNSSQTINMTGVVFSLCSALAYAFFIIVINRNKAISTIPNTLLTFYALSAGALIFFGKAMLSNGDLTHGLENIDCWGNLIGLAILPTIVSTATLAVATRNIGATKASVLGVFEPITAILVGMLAFDEQLTLNIVIGILLAIVAVTFMIVTTKR